MRFCGLYEAMEARDDTRQLRFKLTHVFPDVLRQSPNFGIRRNPDPQRLQAKEVATPIVPNQIFAG